MQYEDLRREAYIEAINLKGENKFVSTFGRVPLGTYIFFFSIFRPKLWDRSLCYGKF